MTNSFFCGLFGLRRFKYITDLSSKEASMEGDRVKNLFTH